MVIDGKGGERESVGSSSSNRAQNGVSNRAISSQAQLPACARGNMPVE